MAAIQTSLALLMIVLGAVLTFAAYLGAIALRARGRPEAAASEADYKPVPPVLVALYVGVGATMIGYVLWAWLTRPNY